MIKTAAFSLSYVFIQPVERPAAVGRAQSVAALSTTANVSFTGMNATGTVGK